MPHDLFEEIVRPRARGRRGSPYTIAGSIAAHVAIIAGLVIAPLLATDSLPKTLTSVGPWVVVVPVPPPPPAPPAPALRPQPRVADTAVASRAIPLQAPEGIHDEAESAPPALSVGPVSTSPDGVIGSVGTRIEEPRAPAPPPVPVKPLPVGGQIREPQKIVSVAPIYPAFARQARISGTVVIQAVIGVDGTVTEARISNSVPALNQAALDAVRQWRYRPTLLNGVPVPVIMTVSVRFTLE